MTALIYAAYQKSVECVRELLPVSDARAMDKTGLTALTHAARYGSAERVRELLPVSDALAVSQSGRKASYLARNSGNSELADMLVASEEVQSLRASLGKIVPAPRSAITPALKL